jgi:hypothetical protein
MLKELRELLGFVLGFLTDVTELIRTSRLSTSPLQSVGRDRALSLQLSGLVGIVLVGIFISTLSDKIIKIDLLPFGTITLIYFTTAAFLVGLAIRHIPSHAAGVDKTGGDAISDTQIDATSYVITFNLIALIIFAVARDLLNYVTLSPGILIPTILAILVTSITMLAFDNRGTSKAGLGKLQKAIVLFVLAGTFLGYALVLSQYAS